MNDTFLLGCVMVIGIIWAVGNVVAQLDARRLQKEREVWLRDTYIAKLKAIMDDPLP